MTQEEKAKAYDKAIERAKSLIGDTIIEESGQHIAEVIFPELKESEDERIRKALIEMVHDTTGDSLWVDYNVHKEDAIAWLEKQSEQKTTWSEEDENIKEDIILNLQENYRNKYINERTCLDEIHWLKSLKERIKRE